MKEAAKRLASNTEVKDALYLRIQEKISEKIRKIQTFGSIYVFGTSHFENDGAQYYLMFQPVLKNFKTPTVSGKLVTWISKGFP